MKRGGSKARPNRNLTHASDGAVPLRLRGEGQVPDAQPGRSSSARAKRASRPKGTSPSRHAAARRATTRRAKPRRRASAGPAPVVWAVIPSRFASTRFPGKALAPIAGKPMIQHVVERTRLARGLARVLVATDDARIRAVVEGFGGEAVMTGDHPTGTDRIHEAVAREARRGRVPDYVLNVQGDEPMLDPGDLERLVRGMVARPEAVMGTLVHPLKTESEARDPNITKAALDRAGRALYFSRSPIPYPRAAPLAGDPAALGWRHVGIYLFRWDFLRTFAKLPMTPLSQREQLEQLRALECGYPIHCFEARSHGLGVDTPEQLQQVEALLKG
jgi:3-deoxy-D-manno-octulosonate cytidylyltransferase